MAASALCGQQDAQPAQQQSTQAAQPKSSSASSSAPPSAPAAKKQDAPTSEDAAASLRPRALFRNLVQDQKAIWTSPRSLRLADVVWLAPLAGATAGMITNDAQFSRHLNSSPSRLSNSGTLSNVGLGGLIGVGGGLYLWGVARNDDQQRETGILSGEAAVDSYAAAELLKLTFRRERPLEGDHLGRFGQGGSSFPSEHAVVAWSVASVIAHEYPGPLTQLLVYGAASAVSVARVTARQHFPSDVLVGSAMGWFIGRQVYRAHHDADKGLQSYGQFVRDGEDRRGAANMGSAYVPLDSWVYGALDRLAAMGYVRSGFAGLRPWTRMECARLVQEAQEGTYGGDESSEANRLVDALSDEFRRESELLGGGRNYGVSLDSIYTRWTGISGTPLRDGYHFGNTIINDFGRPYGAGANNVTGFSSHAEAGPVAFFVQGEYQHAPPGSALPLSARQTISQVDSLPATQLPPATPDAGVSRFRVVQAYVAMNLEGWQLSFGKQSLWWGPSRGGPMLLSNNAEALNMFRVSRNSPLRLPGPLKFLGQLRTEFFLGRLDGYHFIQGPTGIAGSFDRTLSRQPFLHGEKLSFKPTENFEFSVSRTTVFSGSVFPFTWGRFQDSLLSTGNVVGGSENKPGDRRSGLDLSYRIPKLRNWLTFYADGFADDEFSPIAYWDRSAWTAGLYLPQLPKLPKLDLRAEGVYTDVPPGGALSHGFFYFNGTWRSGYTNDGNLLGSWIGRQGQGAQAWTTYHFSPQSFVEANFRHQKVSREFIPQGGTLTDAGVSAAYWFRRELGVSGSLQWERWLVPVIAPGVKTDVTTSIQLTFQPRRWNK